MAIDTRSLDVEGKIYRHYRGGTYRALFEASLMAPSSYITVVARLGRVLHSTDTRSLPLYVFKSHGIVVEDVGHEGEPIAGVVYVSLQHGTVWWRAKSEFEGYIQEKQAFRFVPISASLLPRRST